MKPKQETKQENESQVIKPKKAKAVPLYHQAPPLGGGRVGLILESYFKGVDADIDIVMVGRIPYLDIQYKDFKPTSTVQKELSELLPRLEWTRLERTFSKQAILDELWRMYHEDAMLLIQTDNDTFRSTLLPIHVQERLQFTHIQ